MIMSGGNMSSARGSSGRRGWRGCNWSRSPSNGCGGGCCCADASKLLPKIIVIAISRITNALLLISFLLVVCAPRQTRFHFVCILIELGTDLNNSSVAEVNRVAVGDCHELIVVSL